MAVFTGPTKKEIKWRKITTALLIIANAVLLFPSVFYWSSFMMRQGLGTDYWYDLIIHPWTKSGLGNVGLAILVIIFPAEAVVINWLIYRKKKINLAKWAQIAGGVMMAAGVYAAFLG